MRPRRDLPELPERRRALLARIAGLSEVLSPPLPAGAGDGDGPRVADLARIARFSTRTRLRMQGEVYDRPWLVLVLDGEKRVSSAGRHIRARPGDALWLPARRALDITNIPDPASCRYHALCIELMSEALAWWRARWPGSRFDAALSAGAPLLQLPDLAALDAFVQVCEAVCEPALHPLLVQHRLEGLLLALDLQERRADPNPARARTDLILATRQLVRSNPAARWMSVGIARELGVSSATLRRRLAALGSSVRSILREERMLLARTLLLDGRLDVCEVAARCGYGSPAKFARQFARTFGRVPSRFRSCEAPRKSGTGA